MAEKILMKGNEAIAISAIRNGVDGYFGYPITPQSEVMETLMKERPWLTTGMVVLQAESETSSINMVYGGASCGKKVMTSSSSPGISLMCEGLSYLAGAELPCVIVNCQRGGPGLGTIQPSQSDYNQCVKGGGHGDYNAIVLAPASGQDMYDFVDWGFDLAFKYRTPVIILADGIVGQMTAAIVKLCFEKMIERREDISDPDARPVFLWGDECQFFAIDYDQKFQTTARSSRTLTVYATQNLDNLYDGYGKEKANSLLGNLGTKIFCQNGDHTTNKWAADSIGQEVLRRHSQNIGDSKSGGMKGDYSKSDNYSEGWSEQKDYKVDIIQFTTLQTGGPRGQCQVGYIFWQSGRVLKNGDVYVRSTIKQKCRKVCGAKFERHCPPVPKAGTKEEKKGFRLYGYDWLTFAICIICTGIAIGGFYLIYTEQDHFLLPIPEIGIITVATILLWFIGIVLDTMLASIGIILENVWCLIRRKSRKKCKVINRVPLIVITWLYLGFSLALAVYLQDCIYEQKSLLPVAGLWLAAGIAHRLFKSAGGRKIPVD